jgi:membrane protein DedA with SNARE-associated domain
MTEHAEFLLRHGYVLLFASVFLDQIGLPVPATPILLAAGALAGLDHLRVSAVLATVFSAALLANVLWYELGRSRGMPVLKLLCRISLEPDSCIRTTEDAFARHGARSLLVAKFVPGLGTVAAPMAGVFRMRRAYFVSFDAAGTAIWALTFVGLGYLWSDRLGPLVEQSGRFGGALFALLGAALAGWIGWKLVHRRRFIRQLRIDRITPEDLKQRLDAGEDVVVVDLRGSLDFEADPETIPGARRIHAEAMEDASAALAGASEIILYCT